MRIKSFLGLSSFERLDKNAISPITPVSVATLATQAELAQETLSSANMAVKRPLGFAINLAIQLIQLHDLPSWRVKLDHARKRAGQCDFSNKTISLSRLYVRHAEPDHIRDTILHEIAHAIVGPRHGHGAVWRQKAREIGCTATRCHTLSFARARWVMSCPNGCFAIERHRRKLGLICASCKIAVVFNSSNITIGL